VLILLLGHSVAGERPPPVRMRYVARGFDDNRSGYCAQDMYVYVGFDDTGG
jgi:hypothetical protein